MRYPRVLATVGLQVLILPLCVTALGCRAAAAPELQPASTDRLRSAVQYLASDELEGRGLGTPGLESAAGYIAGYFRGLGLRPPPGQQDYYQPFTLTTARAVLPATGLRADGRSYAQGSDYRPAAISADGEFEGSLVFVGFGRIAPASAGHQAIDDYGRMDVRGKVVLALRHGPVRPDRSVVFPGEPDVHKAAVAAQRGAVALILVQPAEGHGPEVLPVLGRPTPDSASIPVIQIRQDVAEQWLQKASQPGLKALQAMIADGAVPRPIALGSLVVTGNVAMERTRQDVANVAALVPGKGRHAREYIVVGAHYDHIGRGRAGQINNGADDNASGTAAMMELARIFSQAGNLRRSILFVAFTAEEQGMLGSEYWVEHAPVPLERIVAMVNIDMLGRIRNDTVFIGGSDTAAEFTAMLESADAASPLQLKPLAMWKNGIAPSDSASFARRKIPVIFFWSGMHGDLHRPSDDVDKINFEGEAEGVNVAARVITQMLEARELKFQSTPTTRPTTGPSTAPAP